MTSPRYSAGTAFLDVIPSFRGVQKAIEREVRQMEGALGKDAGEKFGESFEKAAKKKVDDVLGTSKAKESGQKAGEDYASGFNQSLNRAMKDAASALKNTKLGVDLDDGKAQAKLKALEFQLNRLGKAKIGVDLDAGQAMIIAGRLQEALRSLQDKTINIDARVELGRALSQVEAFRKQVEKDAKFEVTPELNERQMGLFEKAVRARIEAALKNFPPITFDADVTPAQQKLMELRQRMIELGDKQIGIDIDASEALAEMEALRRELATLANDQDVDVKVRTDAAGAAAELLEIRKLAKLVDDTNVEIEVKIDEHGLRSKLEGLRNSITGAGESGSTAANSFRAFNGMILAGSTLLPAIVPLLGAAAGGLALFGAQAVGAGAGLGVMLLAFSGIGDAVKALGKAQNDAGKDAEASAKKMRAASATVEDAQRSVARAEQQASRAGADAQRAVSDARETAARTAEAGSKRVADALASQQDAERDLARAQESVKRAQEDLTQARRDAQEQIEDLQLSIRGGALAERDALLDIAEAQEKWDAARNSPDLSADDRERLLLDLDQAKFRLDQVRESNGDLAQQQSEVARTGVEGSAQVVAAQQRVQDAQGGVEDANRRVADAVAGVRDAVAQQARDNSDAQRAIADAVTAQTRTQQDSAAAVQDANRNLIQAQAAYRDALFETGTTGSASMQAVNEAMGALGPAGQEFARFLDGLRGQFRSLRDEAQAGMLPGVQDAITQILTVNGPQLSSFISVMATTLGDIFRQLGQMLTSEQWQGIFATLGQYAPIFMQQMATVGFAALTFFGELFRGLAPYAATFGDSVAKVAGAMADWMADFVEGATFQRFMQWLFTEGPKVFETLWNIARAIGNLLIALAPMGDFVLSIVNGVAKFIASMDPRVLGTIVTVMLGLVATFQVLTGVTTLFLLALDAAILPFTGWILVIGAIITLLVTLYTQSETVRNIVNKVAGAVKDFFVGIWDWLKPGGDGDKMMLKIRQFFIDLPGNILDFLKGLPAQLAYWLGQAAGVLARWALDAFLALTNWLGDALPAMGHWFQELPGQLWNFFKIGGGFDQLLGDMFSSMGSGLESGGKGVMEWFKALPGHIWDFLRGDDALGRLGSNIIDGIVAGLKWGWDKLWSYVTAQWQSFIQGFKDAFGIHSPSTVFFDLGTMIMQGLWDGLKALWQAVVDIFISLRDTLVAIAQNIWDWISDKFTRAIDFWKMIFQAYWDFLTLLFTTLRDTLVAIVQNIWDWISDRFNRAIAGWQMIFGSFRDTIVALWFAFRDTIVSIAQNIWDWISDKFNRAIAGWQMIFGSFRDTVVALWNAFRDTIVNVAQTIWDWTTDKFSRMRDGVKGIFQNLVDGVKTIWEGLKGVAAAPINFVVRTVLRDGFVKAFNWVNDTLHLPFHVDDRAQWLQGIPGYAMGGPTIADQRGGGRVAGQWISDRADNVVARLNPGEHVMPNRRVRQYGMDFLEALRHGRIDPRDARSLMGYADGGPVYQRLFKLVQQRWPAANLNSGLRPGANDLHGRGVAVDLGEKGFAGGNGRPYLAAMNNWIYDTFGNKTNELIYDGAGDVKPDIKDFRDHVYNATTRAQHHNHVHWAVINMDGINDGASSPGGERGGVSSLLGGIWDSVAAVASVIKDSITGPIGSLFGQFGHSPFLDMAGAAVGTLPGAAWDAIKDRVSAMWDDIASAGINGGALDWVIDKITGSNVQDIVRSAAAQRGWDKGAQWDALSWIINHESGWNPNAQNPNSTAYGLFQFLDGTWAGTGVAKTNDPAKQSIAGMNYISGRYGNPVAAKAFWQANGWYSEGGPVGPAVAKQGAEAAPTLYDDGGWLPPGVTTVINATNRPEPILTGSAWDELVNSRRPEGGDGRVIDELHLHEVIGDSTEVIADVNHWARVYRNGGRYAGAGRNS